MIKVKGKHYYNDFTQSKFEKSFSNLEALFQWLKEVSYNFNDNYNYIPVPKNKNDVGRISVYDEANRGYKYWIHEISNENGIIFASGETTNNHMFCADGVKDWLIECRTRMKEMREMPNFVEM